MFAITAPDKVRQCAHVSLALCLILIFNSMAETFLITAKQSQKNYRALKFEFRIHSLLITCEKYTVIRSVWVSAKIGTCTVVTVNVTLAEAKMCTFTLESTHFIFNMCPIYTHDGASAKFRTNSQETDYSVYQSNRTIIRLVSVSAKFGICSRGSKWDTCWS